MYGLCGPGVDIESCVVDEDGGLVIDRDDLDVDGRRDRGLGAGPANDGEAVREGVTAVVNVLKEKGRNIQLTLQSIHQRNISHRKSGRGREGVLSR